MCGSNLQVLYSSIVGGPKGGGPNINRESWWPVTVHVRMHMYVRAVKNIKAVTGLSSGYFSTLDLNNKDHRRALVSVWF